MKAHFLRNSLFLISAGIGSTLFFTLLGSKLFYRFAALPGKRGPLLARGQTLFQPGERLRPAALMLDGLRLRPGDQVLKLGVGTGLLTALAARRIGKRGQLYAVDSQPELIDQVQHKLEDAHLTNVQTSLAPAYDLPLEAASIDKALLIDTFPRSSDARRTLAEIARVLKPNGILYIGGKFSRPDYWFISETMRHVEQSGDFVLSTQSGNWWHYTLGFRKRVLKSNLIS